MKSRAQKRLPEGRGFYFITDRALSRTNAVEDARAAIRAGARIVQYREKHAGSKKMLEAAKAIKQLCDEGSALLIINDRIDICLAAGAAGVHLGQDDMPLRVARKILQGKIIGTTVHSLREAVEAENAGADYLGVSPIFETATKSDAGKPCGTALIREVKSRTALPVVAIGGITIRNLGSVLDAGADFVAAISATVAAEDVGSAVLEFRRRIDDAAGKRKEK